MAETHVISALKDKYARLKGEAQRVEATLSQLHDDMAHIKAAIRLFKAEWQDDVSPIRPKADTRWRGRNGVARYALTVLKDADRPLSAREIAQLAVALAGIDDPDNEGLWHIASGVNTVLKRRIGDGVVMIDGKPRRWALEGGWHNGGG